MDHWIRQPVTYNVITIVSLLLFVFLTAFGGGPSVASLFRADALLEQLAAESQVVDEAMVASAIESRNRQSENAGNIYLMVAIALLSSFAANYFGRGRHHRNVARIRELEAQLGSRS